MDKPFCLTWCAAAGREAGEDRRQPREDRRQPREDRRQDQAEQPSLVWTWLGMESLHYTLPNFQSPFIVTTLKTVAWVQ